MPGPADGTESTQDQQADLEKLAIELAGHGLQTSLRTPDGRLPYLHVQNPQVPALSEKIYAQAGAYWYSWAEKITSTDHPDLAASTLARVLATSTTNG